MDICLDQYTSVSMHWSSDCNIACSYCYIKKDKPCMAQLNKKICDSLKDGSYLKNIKEKFMGHEFHIRSLALWGAEPTINGIYFKDFITEFLDHFPAVEAIFFSTNAKVGGEKIVQYFVQPLVEYSETHLRKISLKLQFSLDGPAWINDASRYNNATNNTIQAIDYLLENMPLSDYCSLGISTKPTLDVAYMKIMCDQGIEAIQNYFKFFSDLHMEWDVKAKEKFNIEMASVSTPTLVDPGDHSKEDGLIFAKWLSYLPLLDREALPAYKDSHLIWQPVRGLELLLHQVKIMPISAYECSCSAGHNDITIDYLGNLYTCERLAKNLAYTNEHHPVLEAHSSVYDGFNDFNKKLYANLSFHHSIGARRNFADATILMAAKAGEIDRKYLYSMDDRTALFYASFGMLCHIGIDEDIAGNTFIFPLSYIRLLGNGAVEALIDYYRFEERRLNEQESASKQ